jgi:hypothetical protein
MGRGQEKEKQVEVPHPLAGADRVGRYRYKIEQLDLQILNARQSGVTGENLNRWIQKLKVKRWQFEEKLKQEEGQ